ncbi:MAG TPA: F0F1 ATP synthase subunit B [Phycisphaerae bacterium]|nr:F0F1 ATP synthase subunit B [Phycisphaerae bacterium]HRR84041.1 F0F1 ATP synthase subunit B [Phycisphaerae bacterium]
MTARAHNYMVIAVLHLATAGTLLASEDGRPNLFGGDLGNLVWSLVIFMLVLVILGRFAWKPLLTGLQHREKFIHDSLAGAKRDREEAETRLKELTARLENAKQEASAIVEEGRRDAEVVKRRIEDEARRNAEALIERAKREIGIARDTALRDLHEESAKLAMEMAGAVLKRQLTPEDHRRLVGEALAKLKERGAESRN